MERPNRLLLPSDDARSRLRQRMRGVTRPVINGRSPVSRTPSHDEKPATIDDIYEILKVELTANDDISAIVAVATQLNSLLTTLKSLPADKLTPNVQSVLIEKLIPLIHHSETQIRTAVFRLLRLSCSTGCHIIKLLLENVDYAVIRGLDVPESPPEQQEAYALAAQMMWVYRESRLGSTKTLEFALYPRTILKTIVSLALSSLSKSPDLPDDDKNQGKAAKKPVDRFCFAALSILHDIAISDPERVLDIVGTDWIIKCIIGEGSNITNATLATRVLLKWMDSSELRTKGQLRLVIQQLFSPISDLIFFYQAPVGPDGQLGPMPIKSIALLEVFQSVFLTILQSWSGIFTCAAIDPKTDEIYTDSPFQMLRFVGTAATSVPVLSKIRALLIKLCCRFIDAPYAGKNFTSWDDALDFYATMHLPDEYRTSLRDDFVVSEMDALIASSTLFPDTVDCLMSYRAIACAIFLNAGLAEALIRIVLAEPDDEKGLQATLLLADLLRSGSSFLPRDIRRTLQAVPSLIQAAFQRADLDPQNPQGSHMTFPNSNSAALLIRRIDQVNNIVFGRESIKSSLHNITLFLHGGKDIKDGHSAFGNRSRSGSTVDVELRFDNLIATDSGEYFGKLPLTELCPKKLSSIVDCLEAEDGALFSRHKHSEKLHGFYLKLFTLLYPSSSYLVTPDKFNPDTMRCIGRLVQAVVPLAKVEPYYGELLLNFIIQCAEQLLPDQLYKGTFSAKNILNTNAHYYFVIIAAIGASTDGMEMLENAGLFQIFLELLTSNLSIEYVKLILSSLNYTTVGGIQRTILETVLTSTDDQSRKWCTRFLGVLAGADVLPNDFGTYGMQLVIGQLGDRNAKVVRHALRVLYQWLPKYPEALPFLHHSIVEPLAAAGTFLRAHVFGAEKIVIEHGLETKKEICLWLDRICEEYVAVIEEDMRGVLLGVKKCIKGTYARPSNEKNDKYGVPMPVHLFGALAKHAAGRAALIDENVTKKLQTILIETNVNTDNNCAKVKGALLALGHIVGGVAPGTLDEIVQPEVIPMLVEFAETCPTLSVRGTAFWALNLVGASVDGAKALVKLGWESNRHVQVIDEVVEAFCETIQNQDIGEHNSLMASRKSSIATNFGGSTLTKTKSCSTMALLKLTPITEEPIRPRIFSESQTALPVNFKKVVPLQQKLSLTATKSVPPISHVRTDRAATHETNVTSGFGSAPLDDVIVSTDAPSSLLRNSYNFAAQQRMSTSITKTTTFDPSAVFATSLLPQFEDIVFDRDLIYNKKFDRICSYVMSADKDSIDLQMPDGYLFNDNDTNVITREPERTQHYSDAERRRYKLKLIQPIVTLRVPDRTNNDVVYSFLNQIDLICLNSYQKTLFEAGNWHGAAAPCYYERRAGSFAYWNIVSLPVRAGLLCQNVFVEAKDSNNVVQKTVSVLHKCPKCRRDLRNGLPLTHTTNTDSTLRADILALIGMIEFRGGTLHRELYQHHAAEEIQQALTDPCLYADAIEILSKLRFDSKFRTEIHKLFAGAVKNL